VKWQLLVGIRRIKGCNVCNCQGLEESRDVVSVTGRGSKNQGV